MSAGGSISRIEALELEITANTMHLPYRGADSCSAVVGNLTAAGFQGPPKFNAW